MKTKVKQTIGTGMPWEKEYGYAQAVKVGNTAWLAGQVGTDEKGTLKEGMEAQMQQAYLNAKTILASYKMTMNDVVEEVLYVTDIDLAFESRTKLGRSAYPNPMEIPSTLVQIQKLALAGQMVEIKIVAKTTGKKKS